jgi:hypothetical protein
MGTRLCYGATKWAAWLPVARIEDFASVSARVSQARPMGLLTKTGSDAGALIKFLGLSKVGRRLGLTGDPHESSEYSSVTHVSSLQQLREASGVAWTLFFSISGVASTETAAQVRYSVHVVISAAWVSKPYSGFHFVQYVVRQITLCQALLGRCTRVRSPTSTRIVP